MKKAELEKLIHDFGVRHNNELGELILKILRFRKSKAKGTSQETEAEKDFNDYSKEYEISKDAKINELNEDEQKELKQKYRKASKLCHPDVVSEEQKELADKLFAELNAAYASNDLKRVRDFRKS
ncbi:MAG: DnaJ domain-containing protein [Chitinophagaceae bacterium]|nr:DnaJ domain-containing protein [Chitinophagaceae bacterium]